MDAALSTQLDVHRALLHAKKPPFRREDVVAALASGGVTSYTDIFFTPTNLSVGVEEADNRVVVWKRPKDFLDFSESTGKPGVKDLVEVFDQGIQANDIHQGELGNCWFMCSLGALCEFPALADRLFVQQWSQDEGSTTNRSDERGHYELRFCTSGQWREIVVDDYFPCKATNQRLGPVFSRCKGTEIWVLLIEKAYAKLQGSYYNCRLGDPGNTCARAPAPSTPISLSLSLSPCLSPTCLCVRLRLRRCPSSLARARAQATGCST